MVSSNEHDKRTHPPLLFSYSCESYKFSPHIHADEVEDVKFPCQENGRRNIITCKDEDRDVFIKEVGTLDMHTAHLRGADLSLGRSIPVIPRHSFSLPAPLVSNEIVGVPLSDIFVSKPIYLRDGRYRLSKNLKINTRVLHNPVFQNKKVILLFDERDILLEHLWWDRDDFELFDKLSQIEFYAITTPNFSLFQGECPTGHALNIKKGLVCGEELEKRGMIVIPHIYAVHQRQLERWSDWLSKHPTVKTLAMNCQLQRRSDDGREIAITALRHLLTNTNTHIILNGGDESITSRLEEFIGRLHIASSGAFKKMEIVKLSKYKVPKISSHKLPAIC